MTSRLPLLGVGVIAAAAALAGCAKPPPRVPIPARGEGAPVREHDPVRPLPDQTSSAPENTVIGYDDVPLLSQRPPEQRAFVEAYNRVGRPRIAIFVNRTLQGDIVPATGNRANIQDGQRVDPFGASGETTSYLRPGQYEEPQATALDYAAIENVLTDWLASNGNVIVVSPMLAWQKLTADQARQLESGSAQVLADVAQQLGADVLVQAQVHPTRQSVQGLHLRLVAESINMRGGESIARAFVDVKPPLDKPRINANTRYVARKLMDDMTGAWSNAAAPGPETAPTTAPAP